MDWFLYDRDLRHKRVKLKKIFSVKTSIASDKFSITKHLYGIIISKDVLKQTYIEICNSGRYYNSVPIYQGIDLTLNLIHSSYKNYISKEAEIF